MSRKQSIWIVVIFVLSLFAGLILNFPVVHLLRFIELPDELRINGLQGNIVSGKVDVMSYQELDLTDVFYNIQPGCLIKAAFCYRLKSEDRDLILNFEVNPFSQNITVRQSQVMLESDLLKSMPQLLVQPKGQFMVKIESLVMQDAKISKLVGEVDWTGAGIQGEEQLLGNYTAAFSSEIDALSIKLTDKDSLLTLSGDIIVKWNGLYDIDLNLESRPELNKSVLSVLEMTARKSGLNRFNVKRSGNLSPSSLRYLNMFFITENS